MDITEFDIEFLSQKLSENQKSPLFARLADLYLAKEQTVEALKLCEEGVKNFPDYYAGYVVLGKAHAALKEYSKAREAFSKVKELSPFNVAATKLLKSIPDSPDESSRTTDEQYFTPSPSVAELPDAPAAEPEPAPVLESSDLPMNESLFDTLTPEEKSYMESSEATPGEQQDSAVIEEKPAPAFPSFDEYYSGRQDALDKGTTTLDEYLSEGISQQPQVQIEKIPDQSTEQLSSEKNITEESQPVLQQAPEMPAPSEPEMIVSSPEQAELLAEMGGYSQHETPQQPSSEINDLAEKLQSVERIVPKEETPPIVQPEPTEAQVSYDPQMVTPTLAEIYASQGELGAAIQAYEILMFSQPGKSAEFQQRISELQKLKAEKEGLL